MTYDSTGRILTLKRVSTSLGNPTWGFAYTAFTRDGTTGYPLTKTTVTDPNGHDTVYTANGRGLVTDVKNALGKSESKTYSPNDDVATATGRTSGTGAQTSVNTYEAGETYQLAKTKLPTGAATTYANTNTGANLYNPASSTDPQLKTTSYSYNPDGNQQKTTTTDGTNTWATYTLRQGDTDINAYGNAVINCKTDGTATKKGAVCETRDAAYVAGASRAATTAHRTAYEYNSLGELVTIKPPGGGSLGTQTFTYDGLSRVQTATDGNGKTTTYGYDAMDRRTYTQHADTTVESAYFGSTSGATDGWQQSLDEYGPGGSPLTWHTVYGRDDIGRLNSLQRPEGTIGLGL